MFHLKIKIDIQIRITKFLILFIHRSIRLSLINRKYWRTSQLISMTVWKDVKMIWSFSYQMKSLMNIYIADSQDFSYYQLILKFSRTKTKWIKFASVLHTTYEGLIRQFRTLSYINNLHSKIHDRLYIVIEQIIAKAISLWNQTLTHIINEPNIRPRVKMQEDDYEESISFFVTRNNEIEKKSRRRFDEYEKLMNARIVVQSKLMKFKSFQDRMRLVNIESDEEDLEIDLENVENDSEHWNAQIILQSALTTFE